MYLQKNNLMDLRKNNGINLLQIKNNLKKLSNNTIYTNIQNYVLKISLQKTNNILNIIKIVFKIFLVYKKSKKKQILKTK